MPGTSADCVRHPPRMSCCPGISADRIHARVTDTRHECHVVQGSALIAFMHVLTYALSLTDCTVAEQFLQPLPRAEWAHRVLSRSTLHLQLNKPPFCSSDSISASVWRVPDSLQTALVGACFPAVRLWPHNSSVRCGQRSVRSQGYRKSSQPAHRQCPIPQCSDVHGT